MVESGFPRIRGDVPGVAETCTALFEFSPHTRGCSARVKHMGDVDKVFPAYAGMFRCTAGAGFAPICFPRIRGDVPDPTILVSFERLFSPHTRGCSCLKQFVGQKRNVFPAYAGMFLSSSPWYLAAICFPRIRGDVPASPRLRPTSTMFSPHTRGCSEH